MEIVKELKDISLPISEPEYRQRPELSYSTLSTYESLGYNDQVLHKIPYKYSQPTKVRNMSSLPLGTERVKDRDRVYVKVAKNKWMYKQRYIYEQHYGVKLTPNDFIIFLDGDKTNFNIENLYKITRYEGAHLGNICGGSKNAAIKRLGVEVAKLYIKVKDKENFYEKTKLRNNY